MGQITQSFTKQTIQKMKESYQNCLENAPQGAIFRARTKNAVITAYNSGKVLFQGAKPEVEIENWDTDGLQMKNKASKNTASKIYHPPQSLFLSSHIGSDESGTGDYFGPITTCAVYVNAEQIELLKEMGIQDSKKITDNTIELLSKGLVELNIPYSLMILHNEKYNVLQSRGWSQGKMKTMLHHAVIERLLDKIGDAPYDGILIDQFCDPSIYLKHLGTEGKKLADKTYFMTKAESYSIAVAAGSVIARASFVKEMDRLSEMVGFDLLKGASQKVDQLAAEVIRAKGETVLPKIAKVHFANTEKARRYL
ncbi:ribonuclease HIII [Pseudogracilibacillus sp. SE30717A]|uniref:ribonuclease HIII n=1 Tax=Pseudogracilibacillus sp. SE30717A TaxID=3098293 RepID=UPI00300DF9EF